MEDGFCFPTITNHDRSGDGEGRDRNFDDENEMKGTDRMLAEFLEMTVSNESLKAS